MATTDKLIMLEVMTDKHDIPPMLAKVSAALK
jgi:indolepyruvate decarboxylase